MDSRTGAMKQGAGRVAMRDLTVAPSRHLESLRRRYQPDVVRVLFIGEAPPASGRFFYSGDSGLYRAVRDTFILAFPYLSKDGFLEAFRNLGCYLVDLCGRPVDHLSVDARRDICSAGEVRLTNTIRDLRPKVVVTLVRSIRFHVERALEAAHWSGLHLKLPYPGRWKRHRVEFQCRLISPLIMTLFERSWESAAVESVRTTESKYGR